MFVVEPVVKNKLEKLQLEAARIVTGLPIFTKTDSLYFETGCEPLHRRKLQLFYKIYNGLARQYLHDLILRVTLHHFMITFDQRASVIIMSILSVLH